MVAHLSGLSSYKMFLISVRPILLLGSASQHLVNHCFILWKLQKELTNYAIFGSLDLVGMALIFKYLTN